MQWLLSWRSDPRGAALADRHYNRQKIGAPQFVPPGRCLVLVIPQVAFWITSWPFAEYVKHRWAGAWVCSAFRNERPDLHRSSDLIREAVAATVWKWGPPPAPHRLVTFVDRDKTRRKRDPGRCFRRAGFTECGETEGGLVALRLCCPLLFPAAAPPIGAQERLFG